MDVLGWDGEICLWGGILCFAPNLVDEFALNNWGFCSFFRVLYIEYVEIMA